MSEQFQDLVEVHRSWCNYCQARGSICRATLGTSYECALMPVIKEYEQLTREREDLAKPWTDATGLLSGLEKALDLVNATGYTTAENAYVMTLRIRDKIQGEITRVKNL